MVLRWISVGGAVSDDLYNSVSQESFSFFRLKIERSGGNVLWVDVRPGLLYHFLYMRYAKTFEKLRIEDGPALRRSIFLLERQNQGAMSTISLARRKVFQFRRSLKYRERL